MIGERVQPLSVLTLAALWMAMWGEVSALSAVSGVVVALLILLVFPLPRLTLGLRPQPWNIVVFVVAFSRDLVVASLQVAWLALRPGPAAGGSEVEVRLRSESDLIRALTAGVTSLIPGSVIVDLTGATMRLHVLDVHTEAGLAAAARQVLRTEARIRRALGERPAKPATAGAGDS